MKNIRPFTFNLRTRLEVVVISLPKPFYPQGKRPPVGYCFNRRLEVPRNTLEKRNII
jgi:hypothetical protein